MSDFDMLLNCQKLVLFKLRIVLLRRWLLIYLQNLYLKTPSTICGSFWVLFLHTIPIPSLDLTLLQIRDILLPFRLKTPSLQKSVVVPLFLLLLAINVLAPTLLAMHYSITFNIQATSLTMISLLLLDLYFSGQWPVFFYMVSDLCIFFSKWSVTFLNFLVSVTVIASGIFFICQWYISQDLYCQWHN